MPRSMYSIGVGAPGVSPARRGTTDELPSATRRGGLVGGPKRAKALSPERRSEIARMGQKALQEKSAAS